MRQRCYGRYQSYLLRSFDTFRARGRSSASSLLLLFTVTVINNTLNEISFLLLVSIGISSDTVSKCSSNSFPSVLGVRCNGNQILAQDLVGYAGATGRDFLKKMVPRGRISWKNSDSDMILIDCKHSM